MITPSFALTATERVLPKLALDFTTASLDPRVTFTRTTGASNPATYINSSGIITAATNNEPRFDYDPVTLACKGLLIEESRTNRFRYSENISGASWTNVGCTVSTNQTTSPDGATTADKATAATTGSHIDIIDATASVGVVYSFTAYVKNVDSTQTRILCRVASSAVDAYINWSSASISSITNSVGTLTYQAMPNNWYRITATYTSLEASQNWRFYPDSSVGTKGIYIWGAQLEAGAFATSYIPTTTTALTRNADVATMTGTNFSDWYNAVEGTFVIQGLGESYNTGGLMTLSNAGLSYVNSLFLINNFNNYLLQVYESSSLQFQQVLAGALGSRFQTSFAYASNDAAGAFNGSGLTTDNTYAHPTCDRMFICGNPDGSVAGKQWINAIRFYPQRLTNNEVVAFSKQG